MLMTQPLRRRGLSDRQVRALPKRPRRYIVADPELRGHYVRIPPAGPNVFAAVARDPYGKQIWTTLGNTDLLPIEEARDKARAAIKRVKAGLPAIEAPPVKADTFEAVAAGWIKRHVAAKGLRTRDEIERCLDKYVLPHWREREFASIKRSDITRLLDHLEDNHGSRQADIVLSIVRAIANWHASRNDDYTTPFVRGMSRSDPDAARRKRILNDEELRSLWQATGNDAFGRFVRVLLLTAQRLEKVRTLRWSDIDVDGIWHIRSALREKSNAGSLQLPKLALDIIRAQPRLASNEFVFAGQRHRPINDMGANKAALDESCGVIDWRLHDLRRTARSLMSRAGVLSEHAERVLGHVIKGVEGIYDRHTFDAEKADALQRLASLIEIIINPPADNVHALRRRG
jgi:integrase